MRRMRQMRRNYGFTDDEFEAIPGPMYGMGRMGMRERMHRRSRCKEMISDMGVVGPMYGPRHFMSSVDDSEEALRYRILGLEERITWHKFRLAEIDDALTRLTSLKEDEDISESQLEREKAFLEMKKHNHEARITYLKKLKDLATRELEDMKRK